jgi:MFS family permease
MSFLARFRRRPKNADAKSPWLNPTVLGIGLASLLSDWSHEIATALLPAFLASLGVAAAWLGVIEGVADGLSSFAKMASGFVTDKWAKRKPIAVVGYVVTALGTASFGLATQPWHVLLARSSAWLGRGVRTPVRKALLAGAVTRETYGRAFGFERMMDTIGAILGPATAFVLLPLLHHRYPELFYLTLIPGLAAALALGFLVKEKERKPVKHITLGQSLRSLPVAYRRFLIAVGIFGAGAFAHTMLILLAVQKLTPALGAAKASTVAVGLYIVHNVFSASFAPVGGWLGDHFPKNVILGGGYLLSALMALGVIILPPTVASYALIFILAGMSAALEETLEDSFCAQLTPAEQHGVGFGLLATVNGAGDFLSSIVVGALWTAFGTGAAFGYSAALAFAGAVMVLALGRAPRSHGRSQGFLEG